MDIDDHYEIIEESGIDWKLLPEIYSTPLAPKMAQKLGKKRKDDGVKGKCTSSVQQFAYSMYTA